MSKPKNFSQITTRPPSFSSSTRLGEISTTRALAGALVVPLSQLAPNDFQTRQHFDDETLAELAADITERGILEPLLVREVEDEPGTYEIIAGERRYRAAQLAGLDEVPVIVRQMSDREVRFATIAENIQRADLTDEEEARFYLELQNEFNYSAKAIGDIIHKSASYVQKKLYGEFSHENRQRTELKLISQFGEGEPEETRPVKSGFNPAVFRRVNKIFDSAIQAVRDGDAEVIQQLREDVTSIENKLAELKMELEGELVEEE